MQKFLTGLDFKGIPITQLIVFVFMRHYTWCKFVSICLLHFENQTRLIHRRIPAADCVLCYGVSRFISINKRLLGGN